MNPFKQFAEELKKIRLRPVNQEDLDKLRKFFEERYIDRQLGFPRVVEPDDNEE